MQWIPFKGTQQTTAGLNLLHNMQCISNGYYSAELSKNFSERSSISSWMPLGSGKAEHLDLCALYTRTLLRSTLSEGGWKCSSERELLLQKFSKKPILKISEWGSQWTSEQGKVDPHLESKFWTPMNSSLLTRRSTAELGRMFLIGGYSKWAKLIECKW